MTNFLTSPDMYIVLLIYDSVHSDPDRGGLHIMYLMLLQPMATLLRTVRHPKGNNWDMFDAIAR